MEKKTFKYPIGTWLILAEPSCEYHIDKDDNFIIEKETYNAIAVIVKGLSYFKGQPCYKLYRPSTRTFYYVTEHYIKKYFVRQLYVIKENKNEQRKLN